MLAASRKLIAALGAATLDRRIEVVRASASPTSARGLNQR
jgi:hypothetical protein